jgi:hypothetical protein
MIVRAKLLQSDKHVLQAMRFFRGRDTKATPLWGPFKACKIINHP